MMSANLAGKRALITGASSGLGLHFAKVLAASGAAVVLAARRLPRLESIANEIASHGADTQVVQIDVADPRSVSAAISRCGRLDILINNAGVTNTKPVLDQTEADWNEILDTNLKGAWRVATAVAHTMKVSGTGGSIINVASILGLRQGGQVTPYAVSKAAMVQLTKQLGLELARFDIRVNALAPGYFATELNETFMRSEAGAALIKRIPQRRLGRMEDLDGALLLLASDASRYMTGVVIPVDGGHLVSTL
jgi:NAD(P)-dependent dehydrogenase (short-subunit alcohol dehydrogenase family)